MILENISTEYETDEDIIDLIYKQNEIISSDNYKKDEFESEFKIRTHLKSFRSKETKRIIIEVNGSMLKILNKENINIGWRRAQVKDYISMLQYYNCCGIGHTTKKCQTPTTCANCAGDHDTRECREEQDYCILCYMENIKYNKNINPYHKCKIEHCPINKY